jgi:hypothetical protein
MSPSPYWHAKHIGGQTQYEWFDGVAGDATAWEEDGRWYISYSLNSRVKWIRRELGEAASVDEALSLADEMLKNSWTGGARVENPPIHVDAADVRKVLEVADTVDDKTPDECAAVERLENSLAEYDWWQSIETQPYLTGLELEDEQIQRMSDDELRAEYSNMVNTRMVEGAAYEGQDYEDVLRQELDRRLGPFDDRSTGKDDDFGIG